MTTQRSRRKAPERAADILRADLARLAKRTYVRHEAYMQAKAEEEGLREVIRQLDQLPLPGLGVALVTTGESAERVQYDPPMACGWDAEPHLHDPRDGQCLTTAAAQLPRIYG